MARWGLAATGGIIALIAIFIGGEKPPTGTKPAPGASFVDAAAAPGQHSAMEQPQIKGGETYAEYETRRDSLEGSAGSYEGYGCTQDCSGHDAGYRWAEDNDLTDPDDCGGKSWSFEEGCRSFAEERQDAEAEDDSEQ